MLFIALLAIFLPLLLIAALRLSARLSMTISALTVAISAFFVWGMTPLAISASVAQGFHRSLTILLILVGALTLLRTLEKTGALIRIKYGFHAISTDMRVQAVLVGFGFVSLLEGASGFGTPAIVAAPLLMVLGFRPLAAAVLALVGDTVAVTFGAVATPLLVGLENVPAYSANLTWLVGAQVAAFDLLIGTLLPLGLISILVINFGNQTSRAKYYAIREMLPWSLFIGATYAVSAFVTVRMIGPEFTAIIAAAITLATGMISAKYGFLLPSVAWRHHAKADISEQVTPAAYEHIPLWQAWLPYVVVVGLLLATRVLPEVKILALNVFDASWNAIFGVTEVSSAWPILYSPGTVLLISALVASLLGEKSLRPLTESFWNASKTAIGAMAALVPTLIMVQIFTNSGLNNSGLSAMPVFIGASLANLLGDFWLLFAPFLGAIGAFIAGSATVSTLTMGPVQSSIALSAELPLVMVLALQMVGAAAGNIIAIHNVVAASVVVGLANREELLLKRLIVPTLAYLLAALLIGLALLVLL